jgi:hypothetical protein
MNDSQEIDGQIKDLGDWRGETLAQVRTWIKEADPEAKESLKWRKPSNPGGVPTWEDAGIICTGEVYKDKVKLTFMQGASVEDPMGIFNSSLTAGTRRAVDIKQGDKLDGDAFKALVRAAVAFNRASAR